MKKFLSLSALAVALAGVPTQEAVAEIKFNFGIGFNVGFEWSHQGGHGCGLWRNGHGGHCGHRQQYHYIFPEQAHQSFPPPPQREQKDRKTLQDEAQSPGYIQHHQPAAAATMPSYPSFYQPASWHYAPSYAPTYSTPSYYTPSYYAPSYYAPSYYPPSYQAPALRFDQ